MSTQAMFGSRYILKEELGRGPVGTIHRAFDIVRDEPVALKIIHEQYYQDSRFAIRFREHFKTIARIKSDHLVAIHDYGFMNGQYYVAIELVNGPDLAAHLAAHKKLSPSKSSHIVRQVIEALATIHHHGLVHRGVKPHNILLTVEGKIKLTDLGLTEVISETGLSKTSIMAEGAGYMAPEQALGGDIGPWSDIYSLGVVFFEMLTGQLPFDAGDPWSLVQMHLDDSLFSTLQLDAPVSNDLKEFILKLLDKTPENRFPDVHEMGVALNRATRHGATMALPPLINREKQWPSGAYLFIQRLIGNIINFLAALEAKHSQPLSFGAALVASFSLAFLVTFAVVYPVSGIPYSLQSRLTVNSTPDTIPDRSDLNDEIAKNSTSILEGTQQNEEIARNPTRTQEAALPPESQPISIDVNAKVTFTAKVQSIQGNTWKIGGFTIIVTNETKFRDQPEVGGFAKVSATLAPKGQLTATDIQGKDRDDKDDYAKAKFTGLVESINGNVWTISGHAIIVTGATKFKGEPGVGNIVKVDAIFDLDGSLTGKSINLEG